MKEFPYERAAMNNEPMPDGLDHIDMAMYQALAALYYRYHMGGISRENAKTEKGMLMHKYNIRVNSKKYEDVMYRFHSTLKKNIEGAANEYAKNRTLESADKMYEVVCGISRPKVKEG